MRMQLRQWFRRVRREERGASAVEYALLVSAIAAVVVVGAVCLGAVVNTSFSDARNCLQSAGVGPTYPNCPDAEAAPEGP